MTDNDSEPGLFRRSFMKVGGATALGALASSSVSASQHNDSESEGDSTGASDSDSSSMPRITGAGRLSTRDFHEENYEITHVHRRKEAIRTLLRDPEVNNVVSDWIAHFVGYEPLTNYLDAISVQGPTDYEIEGGLDEGEFEITAVDRQVAYGLVDRRRNELVGLQINDPTDVSWEESYTDEQIRRGEVLLDQQEVQDYLADRDWWAMYKVTEIITAYRDLPHGDATVIGFNAVDDNGLSIVSGYLDVSGGSPEFLDAKFHDDFTRYPVQKMARQIQPNEQTVLGEIPEIPEEKRPIKTAQNGFHWFDKVPDQEFQQDNWTIEWEPPATEGSTLKASYNGKPVFEAMNAMATPTGYGLPPRKGRNTREWFFPDDKPVFNGHLLFWDIHSIPFGGPGTLAKVDYPDRRGHPSGFQFRTHYHTGAQGRGSIDFHSGAQFGPYNYNISYEFFEDGRFIPIWRRHGPGYVVEALKMHEEPDSWEGPERVAQQYLHMTALDVTPNEDSYVIVETTDGDGWVERDEDFYKVGEPGHKVRFRGLFGDAKVEIPMDRSMELVVVDRDSDEMGPHASQKTRAVDVEEENAFYHPAQYVEGDDIYQERVIAWLIVEGTTGEVPHPAAVTGYTAQAELQLKDY